MTSLGSAFDLLKPGLTELTDLLGATLLTGVMDLAEAFRGLGWVIDHMVHLAGGAGETREQAEERGAAGGGGGPGGIGTYRLEKSAFAMQSLEVPEAFLHGMELLDLKGRREIDYGNEDYYETVKLLIESGHQLYAEQLMYAMSLKEWSKEAPGSAHVEEENKWDDYISSMVMGMVGHLPAAKTEGKGKKDAPNNVNINTVQIAVTSNEEPSRVAYAVATVFQDWKRNRRSSPDGVKWSESPEDIAKITGS